jgi:hypothetical protein
MFRVSRFPRGIGVVAAHLVVDQRARVQFPHAPHSPRTPKEKLSHGGCSIGRVPVSKAGPCGFDSHPPCCIDKAVLQVAKRLVWDQEDAGSSPVCLIHGGRSLIGEGTAL